MNERRGRRHALKMARRTLEILEEQAAGYTVLTIPANLVNEIEAKRMEIKRLEALLAGRSGEITPSTLPRREPFFGREKEIVRALDALSPEDRGWGLMIDGMGGIGKTALAVEVAHITKERALFDVFFFTTAKQSRLTVSGEQTISDAATTLDAMLSEIARALGEQHVAELAGTEKHQGLLKALQTFSGAERRVLLILDNLETITSEERMTLSNFLRRLPQHCKAIITSRRRTSEGAVWLRLDKLEWEAACQLITDQMHRASNLQRILSQAGKARWQELYDATGGSPLALQWMLGLMRVRCISLDRVLEILRKEDTSGLPLYQFIYYEARRDMGTDDWKVLSALSLFATPTTFEHLTAVTEMTRLTLESILERLYAFSLVNMYEADSSYSLHPLTRRLASNELSAQPDTARSLRMHFGRYWLKYAEKYGGETEDAYRTFNHLRVEWPNLEAAAAALREASGLPNSLHNEEAARILNDLVLALRTFLWFRGYWDERVRLSEWAYQAAEALEDWWSAGWRAYDVAWIHYNRDETNWADIWAKRMAEAMELGGNLRDQATATRLQGLLAMQRDDLPEARQLFNDALDTYRALKDENTMGIVLNDLGNVERKQDAYSQAEKYYLEALAMAEKVKDNNRQAVYFGNLGEMALERDRPAEARSWFERQLELAREVERQDQIASAQVGLSRVLEAEGYYAEALTLAREALRIREQLRHRGLESMRQLVARLQEKVEGNAPA